MKARVIRVDPQEPKEAAIKEAAGLIKEGGLVVIPTETVYGIAANALSPAAMQRLSGVKQRPQGKPFSLHIASSQEAEKYAVEIPPAAYRLMGRFWPGPLTLVLKSREAGTIGMRVPNHKVALSIIAESGVPVALPSANISGAKPARTAQEALTGLSGAVDLVVDCGRTMLGEESTVVDATVFPVRVLREGAITNAEIQESAGKKAVLFVCTGNSCRSVMAKGLLEKKLREQGRGDVRVWSAGVMMMRGMRASAETQELLRREGIDASGHRSQQVTREMIRGSDMILIMEKRHEQDILALAPESKNRVFLLKEFARIKEESIDIADPIGKSLEFYEQTFRIIMEAVDRIAGVI